MTLKTVVDFEKQLRHNHNATHERSQPSTEPLQRQRVWVAPASSVGGGPRKAERNRRSPMRKGKSGILVPLSTHVDTNGFLNRRSPVRIGPGSQGSNKGEKPRNHREFIATAMAAGASEVGAHLLERDLLAAGRRSRNSAMATRQAREIIAGRLYLGDAVRRLVAS